MIEMIVDNIRYRKKAVRTTADIVFGLDNYDTVMILKEKTGERYLPIFIFPSVPDIFVKHHPDPKLIPLPHDPFKGIPHLSHDILLLLIKEIGGLPDSITVDSFSFAKIIFKVECGSIEVKSRPDEALGVAVRANIPIFIDNESDLKKLDDKEMLIIYKVYNILNKDSLS